MSKDVYVYDITGLLICLGRQPPLAGSPPGRKIYLSLHRSRQLRILGTGTQLFITESFHRDKAQAERTINFVRSIEKSARDYIGSCKKTHIERTNTNHERNIKHRKKFKHLVSSVI